jgi:hypothetical protein
MFFHERAMNELISPAPIDKAQSRSHFLSRPLALGRRMASRHTAVLIVLARAVAGIVLVAGIATVASVMFALPWQTDSVIATVVAVGWVAFGDPRNPGL